MFELKRKILPAYTKYDFYYDLPREPLDSLCSKVIALLPKPSEAKGDIYKEQALHFYEQYVNWAMYSPGCARGAMSRFFSDMYRYYEPARAVIEAHFREKPVEETPAHRDFYISRPKQTYDLVDQVAEMYEHIDLFGTISRDMAKIGQHTFYVEYVTMLMEMQIHETNPLHARADFLANLYAKIKPVKDMIDAYLSSNPS